jgi:uncharacterized protein YhdP
LSDQPSSIPALDIVVNDLTLRGKKLGRLEILAVNQVEHCPQLGGCICILKLPL